MPALMLHLGHDALREAIGGRPAATTLFSYRAEIEACRREHAANLATRGLNGAMPPTRRGAIDENAGEARTRNLP